MLEVLSMCVCVHILTCTIAAQPSDIEEDTLL